MPSSGKTLFASSTKGKESRNLNAWPNKVLSANNQQILAFSFNAQLIEKKKLIAKQDQYVKEQAVNDLCNIVKIKLQEKSMHAMHKTADTDFWNHVNMFSELSYWL